LPTEFEPMNNKITELEGRMRSIEKMNHEFMQQFKTIDKGIEKLIEYKKELQELERQGYT
jgi:hypothetical protein